MNSKESTKFLKTFTYGYIDSLVLHSHNYLLSPYSIPEKEKKEVNLNLT